MGDIHIDTKLRADLAVREMLAATFQLVADVPTTVTTGCGQRVPLAMTSGDPGVVTCPPCREFAQREHLRLADLVQDLGLMPGSVIAVGTATSAAAKHREIAARFGGPVGG
ncbi:hypothetical protein AB0F81_48560 [Actinoplanes sp. NPDC024001]|uniref:hypothetical protein n=1 Tax=Actinoplanes sp. NPDC024001 TaxID=3154598 RepID=UPI0033E8F9C3